MKKTFLAICAVAVGLLTMSSCGKLEDSIDGLRTDLDALTQRVDKLEKDLNADVKNLADLTTNYQAAVQALQGTDKTLQDALAALQEGGEDLSEELKAAIAKIAVVAVEEKDGKVVLTLADGSTVELSKPLENVENSGLVTIVEEGGVKYWAVNGQEGHTGVPVGHPEYSIEFQINKDTRELEYSVNGGEWVSTGVKAEAENAAIMTDFVDGEDYVEITVNDVKIVLPKYAADNSVLQLARADFFLRYEGQKTVQIVSEAVTECYVMAKPDGWKANIVDGALVVTAPTKKAVEIGAAETEGQVLLHATTLTGACKVAKVDVKAGPGLTLSVDINGNVTVENSYYGESTNMWGETSFGFSDFILGLATPSLFHEDPQAYVQYYNDNWGAPSWDDIIFPSAYNIAEQGIYVEGEYETDIVKTTVADAYFMMFYEDLPDGANYVVWVAPADGEGKAVIEDMLYTDYVNIKWNVAVKEVTHSDITLTAEVAGASKFIINAVAESSYNSEWNPMSFDEYMNAPMGGPWNGFKSYGAADALGLVVNVEDVPAEFKLSDILGQQLAFGENYKIWVMPVFDHLAIYDEANSMPEYDLYVYDFSAFDYEDHFLPFVLDAKTNELEAGGEYAATLKLNRSEFSAIYVDVEVAEGTESVYYYWYTPEEYAEYESDAAVMEALFMDCYSPLTENGQVNKSYINPGDEYVLATVSIGTDGKYGEIVTGNFAALEIPYDENITVELVSAVLDDEGTNYTVTVNVTGATKVMGYNLTHSDYYYGQFPLTVCKNGHKTSYSGYQMADVVDGQAVLTFSKSNYKKDYYVAAYNVTDGVVSAISAEFVVEHLFD